MGEEGLSRWILPPRSGGGSFLIFALPLPGRGLLFARAKRSKRSLKELRSLRILLNDGGYFVLRFHWSPSGLNWAGSHGSGEAFTRRRQRQTLPYNTGELPKRSPGDSACMTVGAEVCSWVDEEDWRTNEGTKIEQARYVGAKKITSVIEEDSQGT